MVGSTTSSGTSLRDAEGVLNYEALWALSPTEEKRAFERLIDLIVERRGRDPAMHVYHYAPYEPTAMKRLMGRYGTRADELDQLLRAKVFVDLYSVVRKGLRAGVDSYSIKKLEPFYGLAREVDLRQASRHLRAVEYAIARRDSASLTATIREAVRSYNRDDCASALGLRDWLERLRLEAERNRGEPIPRPAPPLSQPNEKLEDRLARIRAVSEALTAQLPVERTGPRRRNGSSRSSSSGTDAKTRSTGGNTFDSTTWPRTSSSTSERASRVSSSSAVWRLRSAAS